MRGGLLKAVYSSSSGVALLCCCESKTAVLVTTVELRSKGFKDKVDYNMHRGY